jgi:hypothetical protein
MMTFFSWFQSKTQQTPKHPFHCQWGMQDYSDKGVLFAGI